MRRRRRQKFSRLLRRVNERMHDFSLCKASTFKMWFRFIDKQKRATQDISEEIFSFWRETPTYYLKNLPEAIDSPSTHQWIRLCDAIETLSLSSHTKKLNYWDNLFFIRMMNWNWNKMSRYWPPARQIIQHFKLFRAQRSFHLFTLHTPLHTPF